MNFFVLLISAITCSVGNASVGMCIKGSGEQEKVPWAFPVSSLIAHSCSAQAYKGRVAQVFVAASCPLQEEQACYGISFAMPGSPELSPVLTDTRLVVNNAEDQPNPVLGKGVAFMSLLGINPLVVTTENLSELILLNITTEPRRVHSATLYDAHNKPAAACGIAVLQNPTGAADVIVVSPNVTIAVPVRPRDGVFGDRGSGISMLMTAVARNQEESDKKIAADPRPEDLVFGVLGVLPLDYTSALLALGSPISKLADTVTIHAVEWLGKRNSVKEDAPDKIDSLGKFFVGVNVTSNSASGDGAVAVCIAQTIRSPGNPVFTFMNSIVTPSAVGNDAIVAARTADGNPVTVAAHALRVMRTTTGLDYLIVQGGVGDALLTKRRVYALPIVRESGMLANVQVDPVTTYYTVGSVTWPLQRSFVTPAAEPRDLYTSTSMPARVGGGELPSDPRDIMVVGDAVFVVLENEDTAALWHSQAIVDGRGVILAWTAWQKSARAPRGVNRCAFDRHAGTWWYATKDPELGAASMYMTSWNQTSLFVEMCKKIAETQGTIHSVHDIPAAPCSSRMLAVAGNNFIGLINVAHPGCTVQSGNTIDTEAVQVWAGEHIANLGEVHTVAAVTEGSVRWLIAGGTRGVALLTLDKMAWRLVSIDAGGNAVSHVKKIVVNRGNIYLLTSQLLLRISGELRDALTKPLTATVLATVADVGGVRNSSFTDVFIEGPLALLATTVGCFRNGNETAINSVINSEQANWMKLALPYSPGPVVKLCAVGLVMHQDDAGCDANIYVLSAALSSSQARVYRLAVSHKGVLNNDSVVLFPDEMTQGNKAFFLSVGDYRNGLATDGASLWALHNCYGGKTSAAEVWDPDWHTWPFSLTKSVNIIRGAYRGVTPAHAQRVYDIVYSKSIGAWLVLTDVGVVIHD
jgi:hypothetical protein